jgi:hypothetical protein
MNTVPLRNVSALKGPSLGSKTDTCQQDGQQNYLIDVKFSLVRCLQYMQPNTLHAGQQTEFYMFWLILLFLLLKCVSRNHWRKPFEGWKLSERHSVDKVVLIINVYISQFLCKLVILVKNLAKVSVDFTQLVTRATSLLEVPGLKLGAGKPVVPFHASQQSIQTSAAVKDCFSPHISCSVHTVSCKRAKKYRL